MKKQLLVALAASLGVLSGPSWGDTPLKLHLEEDSGYQGLLLAKNESTAAETKPSKNLHVDFKEPTFTGEKFHQYLGLTTLGLVALTAVLPKEEEGPHETAGKAAALMAGATVGTGLVYHWEDFHFEDGFSDPDNLHFMLGTLGAVLMAAAISQAPEGGHAGLGIGGGVMMASAVKITW